eukprot:862491-Amphidinium_carterae.1
MARNTICTEIPYMIAEGWEGLLKKAFSSDEITSFTTGCWGLKTKVTDSLTNTHRKNAPKGLRFGKCRLARSFMLVRFAFVQTVTNSESNFVM